MQAALSMLLLACFGTVAVGSEKAKAADGHGVSTTHADPDVEAEKERAVTAGVLLLVLVIGVVAALLVVVVLWGRRVRRTVRKPTTRIVPGDALWFLKPNKNKPATRPAVTPQADALPTDDTDLPGDL
jgi:beta-lactamase regulating signal transducer with metallopeptidase domain